MKSFLAAISLAFCMAWPLPETHAQQPRPMSCVVGPVHRAFGGTRWLVYSCADGKSLAVITEAGNIAAPFYFIVAWSNGRYSVSGEGNGSEDASNATGHDLEALTAAQIAALIAETRAVRRPATASPPAN